MYAIYTDSTRQLSFFEDDDDAAQYVDLNEAEELLRRIRRDDPREFERITKLPEAIRGAMTSTVYPNSRFVFCQAGRYQQLFLIDQEGEVVSREIGRVLGAIKATPETAAGQFLPRDYNEIVMRIKRRFTEEVTHRRTLQEHSQSLNLSQQYIVRELRLLFDATDDEDLRLKINVLDHAFRLTPTTAVKREIDFLRRNGLHGEHLVEELLRVYQQHRLQDRLERTQRDADRDEVPHIVCSAALM